MSKVGDRIHVLRIKRGLSQSKLAKAVGLKRSAIGNYEQGIREPDLDTIEALADFFDVSIADLMGREEGDLQEKLNAIGEQLTSHTRSKQWRILSEGFEEFERERREDFQMIFKFLTNTYPDIFRERNDDDDPES